MICCLIILIPKLDYEPPKLRDPKVCLKSLGMRPKYLGIFQKGRRRVYAEGRESHNSQFMCFAQGIN